MTISVNGTTVINLLTREFTLGTATPGSPVTGMIRFNSSLSQFEVYNGTAWVSITSTASAAALWTWGDNSTGGLGTGTGTGTTSPVSVIGGFTDWVTISSGLRHTTGIRANGTAWSWGWNQYGNLGNNTSTTLSMSSPVSVIGGFTDWIQVSNGQYHSAALRADGSAWCWGRANFGALGNGVAGIVHRSSPVSVLGGFTWTNISASAYHTLAVRSNGTAWAWGLDGGYSRLG
jgi:alpha-tubulin suppressor-like RCC1 family protein